MGRRFGTFVRDLGDSPAAAARSAGSQSVTIKRPCVHHSATSRRPDIAEDFNLSGRGKSRSFSLRSVGPRPVRLKVECTKPLLDLAGQLLYVVDCKLSCQSYQGFHCEIRLNTRRRPLGAVQSISELRGDAKQLGNESGLRDCILFRHPSHSALPNHMHCFRFLARSAKRLRMIRTLSPATSAASPCDGLAPPHYSGTCVRRERRWSTAGKSRPGTGSLHPVAIGAAVEVTKLLKPLV